MLRQPSGQMATYAQIVAAKRKQDELFTKLLRELASLPANRNCFDCGQRGPTYVNMTIGSYICTTCSGLLRGLQPPHRIKSIAMASFSQEEVEFLKATGNELCSKAYFAMFDGNHKPPKDSSKNPQAVRDFMVLKYERRQWFVAPTAAQHDEARRQNNAALDKLHGHSAVSRPRPVSMHHATRPATAMQDSNYGAPAARPDTERVGRPNSSQFSFTANSATNGADAWPTNPPNGSKQVNAVPTLIDAANKLAQANANANAQAANRLSSSGKSDVIADFGYDPFVPSPKPQPLRTSSVSSAPFDDVFGLGLSPPPTSPGSTNGFAKFDVAFGTQPPTSPTVSTSQVDSASKYSALAELDELLKLPATVPSQPVAASNFDPFVTSFSVQNQNAFASSSNQASFGAPLFAPSAGNAFSTQAPPQLASNNPFINTNLSSNPFIVSKPASPPQNLPINSILVPQPAPFAAQTTLQGNFTASSGFATTNDASVWPSTSASPWPNGNAFGMTQQPMAFSAGVLSGGSSNTHNNPFL